MGLLFDSYVLDILLAVATLIFALYTYLASRTSYWKVRGIPYVKPINLSGTSVGGKPIHELYMDIYKAAPEAKVIGHFQIYDPVLTIRDPALVEKVMIKEFASFHDRGTPVDLENEPLSGGLSNVEGLYWRNLRSKMTPTFTTGKLKSMVDQMSKCADNLVKYIEKEQKVNNGSPLEGKRLVQQMTVDVTCSCAFGLEFSHESEEGKHFRKMVAEVFAPSKSFLWRLSLQIIFPKLGKFLRIKTFSPEINEYFMNLMKETIRFRRSSGVKRDDFLQLLLTVQEQEQNNKKNVCGDTAEEDAVLNQLESVPIFYNSASTTKIFTDECVAAQCFSFLTGGSEAVASVASYCLYALGKNMHVQEKLRKEVDSVLEERNGKLDYEALKEMKYMDQVINETLRLYTPFAVVGRKCNRPFLIPDTKCVVEPGIMVYIPLYALHHDEKYFPDPYTFDPERFAEGKKIHRGTYLPFGDGPRNCIGMRFAQIEIKLLLAKLVSKFNISVNKKTVEPLEYDMASIFVVSKDGLWIDFDKRIKV